MNVKLPSELNIRQVAELKEQLSDALGADSDIVLDASDVDTVDTAALQLLLAFVQQAALKKHPLEWGEVTEVLLSAVRLLGLSDSLSLQD